MKIFLDTSSLFKLYQREVDTDIIESLFSKYVVTHIYLSEITKIEFLSTLWKKVRTKEISSFVADTTLQLFDNDFEKYTFVTIDSHVIESARKLMNTHGLKGLRTLDSIQLCTAISLKNDADLFITSDNLLQSFLKQEKLQTEIPI